MHQSVRTGLFILAALTGGSSVAQGNAVKPKVSQPPKYVEFDTQTWQKCEGLSGCDYVLLNGDPAKSSSQWIFRLKAGTPFPRHWHSTPENITGIRGRLVFHFETGDTRTLRAGDYLSYQAGMIHGGFCMTGEDCLYYVFNDLPYDIHLVSAKK